MASSLTYADPPPPFFCPAVALQTMTNVELTSKGLLQRITACHVATYYHVGFAYMALGRYPDAIKTFISVLIYFNRMKQYHTRSYQYGSVRLAAPGLGGHG